MADDPEDARETEDAAQRARIVAMREEGFTLDDIAEETGLTSAQVLEVLRAEGMQ
jgi:uncharacterized protein YerC